MFKLFGSTPDAGQLTPRAPVPGVERNPFDSLQSPSRKSSVSSVVPSGARTPTARGPASFHSSGLSGQGGPGFFGSGGAGDVTPGATPYTPGGVPTTGE